MAAEVPLINGRAYDFSQIQATVLGVPLQSITEINYTEVQEKTNNMGAGTRPVSRGHGAIEPEASIGLSMNDIEALRAVAPGGSLLKIPAFDITDTYLHPTQAQVVTHVLKNAEFTDDGVEASQGDTDINRTFALVISNIKFN